MKNIPMIVPLAAGLCSRSVCAVETEYAAGAGTVPFSYTATMATAARPANLDFSETHGSPDNCQALVRIEGGRLILAGLLSASSGAPDWLKVDEADSGTRDCDPWLRFLYFPVLAAQRTPCCTDREIRFLAARL